MKFTWTPSWGIEMPLIVSTTGQKAPEKAFIIGALDFANDGQTWINYEYIESLFIYEGDEKHMGFINILMRGVWKKGLFTKIPSDNVPIIDIQKIIQHIDGIIKGLAWCTDKSIESLTNFTNPEKFLMLLWLAQSEMLYSHIRLLNVWDNEDIPGDEFLISPKEVADDFNYLIKP